MIRRRVVRRKNGVRVVTFRKPSPAFAKQMEAIAAKTLQRCEEFYREYDSLDTAIRDISHDAIARLLHIAYDCRAIALGLANEEWTAFVDTSTAEWFRTRGYAEWYCLAAGCLFHRSRPRILTELNSYDGHTGSFKARRIRKVRKCPKT